MGAVQLKMHEPVAEVVVANAAVMVDFKMVDAIQDGVSSSSCPGLALDQKPSVIPCVAGLMVAVATDAAPGVLSAKAET